MEEEKQKTFSVFGRERFSVSIQDLIKGIPSCACGKSHSCPIDAVEIGEGALTRLPALCDSYQNIVLVADDHTWEVCGKQVAGLLGSKVQTALILHAEGVVIPDEKAIEEVRSAARENTDLYVGVGSGVINDLCKYVSFGLGLPYYIVATAPSMDGYASVGCALILEGMKVTLNARPPKAILAEQSVLQNAPMEMLQAGYGDIIGKFSCLNDWKLSALLNGEYFCQAVYDLTYDTAVKVKSLGEGVANRDGEAVSALMDALVTVGIAMSYVGNSRPASGSEHHLSHFFEITGILDKRPYFSHGIDVAYSSVITADVRKKLLESAPLKRAFDKADYEANIRRIYTTSADGILELQYKIGADHRDTPAEEKWEEVKTVLRECPTSQEFEEMLSTVGLTMDRFWDMYGEEKVADAVLYAKDLKDRYTVLNLNYDFFRR